MVFKLKPLHLYLTLGVVFLIIGVVLKILSSTSSKSIIPPPPLPSGITNPNPSLQFKGKLTVPQEISSVLTYSLAVTDPDTTANIISQLFSVGSAQKIVYPNGQTKFTWSPETIELNYYPDRNYLSYLNSSILASSNPVTPDLVDQANVFIQTHLPLANPVAVQLVSTTYLRTNQTVAQQVSSPSQANLIQFEFRYVVDNQPLYVPEYSAPDIIISINSEGVRNFKVKVPPQIIASNQKQKLLPPSEIQQQLTNHQYTIVKVNHQRYYESGPQFNIATMTISSTRLGYIINLDKIYPVFIVGGTASQVDSPNTNYTVEVAINALAP